MRGLRLARKGAQLAAAAGDVDLRAPAVPVGAHATEVRAFARAARAQLRRQRRMRLLAYDIGKEDSKAAVARSRALTLRCRAFVNTA